MIDSLINYFDKFGPELLVIQFGFLVILSTLFLWLWFSNRRKYHNLKHAIPANVVKSYLDSIIQNSTALKSSLFRGGGLEVNGIPSVMPLHNLMGGDNLAVSGAPSTALLEELNQKKAQIAALEAQLSASQNAQKEIEARLAQTQASLTVAEAKIRELEALLAKARAGGGGDEILKSELQMVTKERNEIRDRLKEFEIISDDLANLKRLQQENEQLKRSLAAKGTASGGHEAATATFAPADVSDLLEDLGQSTSSNTADSQALEDFLSEPEPEPEPAQEEEEEMIAAMDEAAPAEDERPKSEKTPEDLLSEFEKMLG
ncbi:MAG TPA: hypothetical protein VNJ08_12365 [Bacteriovoracaceae bacterium]|nr:hypothetical protein [Bacteriovoracaceae bacterium]